MTLIRWSPNVGRELTPFRDEFDRLFDNFLTRSSLRGDVATFAPPVDIEETPEEFVVRADLPGISQKDVKVSLMADNLTIRAERKLETEKHSGNMHRQERVYGTFERTFSLGAPVRNDKVRASYRDGVLEVHVPKAEEARLREIEVQVG
jgi:HSP20 family protein